MLGVLDFLDKEWREKRNEIIHTLFNKNYEESIEQAEALMGKAYSAMRALDNAVRQVKRYKIREKMKMAN